MTITQSLTRNLPSPVTSRLTGILEVPLIADLKFHVATLQEDKKKAQLIEVNSVNAASDWFDFTKDNSDVIQNSSISQPIYTLDSINGHPALAFDGVNDFMTGPSALHGIPEADHTIFFVAHLASSLDELQCILSWNDDGGAGNGELFCFSNTTGQLEKRGDIGNDIIITDDLRDTNMIVTIAVEEGNFVNTNLNGAFNTLTLANPADPPDAFAIGMELDSGTGASNFLDGEIGEILIYSRELSSAEIVSVEDYLSKKWGIPLA